jgi:protein required for attachment to host cells
MLMMTRRDLEILLDRPDRRDFVVSAYLDLRVSDGFHRDTEVVVRNLARDAMAALSDARARKSLERNIEPILKAIAGADPSARALAVFSSVARGLLHVVSLDFPVETRLIIDEEAFVLPLLERWYAIPRYLVARISSHELHLFESHAGVTELAARYERSIPEDLQRDKPRFTQKKRLAAVWHERLQSLDQDEFLKQAAETLATHYDGGRFDGLILLGQPPVTAALRRLLPRALDQTVVEEASLAMSDADSTVAQEVHRVLDHRNNRRTQVMLEELADRWKENHHVANGPTDVLDALQQGRATQILIGQRRDLPGASCPTCRYRFGAPIGLCVYCQSPTRAVNAVQEILKLAMRQRVPVQLLEPDGTNHPLWPFGEVVALTRADAHWAASARRTGTGSRLGSVASGL